MVQLLLTLILCFVVVGLALYLVNAFVPMSDNVKNAMNVVIPAVAAILAVLWLMSAVGDIPLPRLR